MTDSSSASRIACNPATFTINTHNVITQLTTELPPYAAHESITASNNIYRNGQLRPEEPNSMNLPVVTRRRQQQQ
jgi:hypothetical protein